MKTNSISDFELLARNHADKAYNFAYYLAGNESDARDLVQEAFAHAFKHFDRFDLKRPFGPWCNRIMKNIFVDCMRRYERKHSISLDSSSPIEDTSWEQILPGKDTTPLDEMTRMESYEIAKKSLNSLPPLYKTVLLLCDVEKYSYERIAEVVKCPVGTVRSRVHQGRILLREAYERLMATPFEFKIQAVR